MSNDPFLFDPEKANLYESLDPTMKGRRSLEEMLAETHGGEPVEWFPKTDDFASRLAMTIEAGDMVAMVAGNPETEGVFAGYYAVKVPQIDTSNPSGVELKVRIVYASPEQIATGEFFLPKEGLFCIDTEN